MVDANAIVSGANEKIVGSFKNINWVNTIGWMFFIIIIVAGAVWIWVYYKNKKVFNKRINVNGNIGGFWRRVSSDVAKSVKLGIGGFEVLYLKKLKSWKIAYGGNFGDNIYEFYVMPDGYWYNSRPYGDVKYIDQNKGMVAVVTTNPLMRGQYTSLEKQIETLHGEKVKFWDKYGTWVLGIAFVLIAGVMLWLNYKEYVTATGNLNTVADKFGMLIDKLNLMQGNTPAGGSGLIPVK
jgi:hypothetical protein